MSIRVLGLTVGLLSLAAQAQAQYAPIPAGTTGISPIAGKITNVEQRRVAIGDAITGSETRVTLQFTLQGCVDKLLPLISRSEVRGDLVTFYVTALNAHNKESTVTMCVAPPQAKAQVSVPGIYQQSQINVIYLGTDSKTTK